jgi:hypothetical protein
MTGSQRAAKIGFASAIIGGVAVGFAGPSQAEPGGCDPMARSMTPHQPSACDAPPAPLAPEEAPPVDGPAVDPVSMPPGALPPVADAPVGAEFPPPADS